MIVGVLAVQGAFAEHEKVLEELGIKYIELRNKSDVEKSFDGLILPGGESTVQGKLLKELDMLDCLKEKICAGMPVLATCAGLILLAERLSNDENAYLRTLPVTVKRNAYGRQLASFYTESEFGHLKNMPMKFIRAPYIEEDYDISKEIEVLARIEDNIVGVRYNNQIGLSFHPELTDDVRIHQMFLNLMNKDIGLSF